MDRKTINELVDQRMRQIQAEQDRLVECWKPFIGAVDEYLQETQNRITNVYERRNIAQCLENALIEGGLKSRNRLFEATTEDSISFLGIQLPVIAALIPSLIANEIANTQALDRRIGAVFFLDVKYTNTKGTVTAGDTMMSAKTGHARANEGERLYASTLIRGEAIASSSGGSGTVTGNLAYRPGVNVTNGTIVVRAGDGTEIGSDRTTPGTIAGDNCTGTVTGAGVYSLAPVTTWDSDGITIDYEYQYDKPYNSTTGDYYGVPEADVAVTQEDVRAIDFPIRSKYSIGASIDLQKAHGINLETEIVKYLGGEIEIGLASLAIAA